MLLSLAPMVALPLDLKQQDQIQFEALRAHDAFQLADKLTAVPINTPKYKVKEQPFGTLRPLKVVIIGAGVNGLNMLHTLRNQAEQVECVIYEKNPECGGTWYENRNPGCASDDPSHHYQFPHTPNLSWSSVFAQGAEIKEYLENLIDENDLRQSIHCNSTVSNAQWNRGTNKWLLDIKNTATGHSSEVEADIFVDATGIFNDYKWPQIEGLQSFKGNLIHTANWPSDFEFEGKTVAVLGNGASGVQIVPAIQPHVKKLVHCIRSKTWIAPPSKAVRYCHQYTTGSSNLFSDEWIRTLAEDPQKYKLFLDEIDSMAREDTFKTILNGSDKARESMDVIRAYMTNQLNGNQHLIDSLIPNMPVGCRRITSSTNYLEALCQPNVEVETSPITQVTENRIILGSGKFHIVDAIICATGFNTSFLPRFPIIGDSGLNLQDTWSEHMGGPKAYMSMMVEGMPNYFRILGPNGPLAHGAVPRLSTHMCNYILSHIRKMQLEAYSSIRPLSSAVSDFNEHIQAFMPRTAWAGTSCGGWYRTARNDMGSESSGPEERVTALHPGSQLHWEEMLRNVRWEDFQYGRGGDSGKQENRFAYLGNGFVVSDLGGNS
ncbi:hypothetical protein ONS96_013089 [Cadophora gregata f. sp. sojae]|nr:hypothetical protein ONS96_013089 [Cadophora gregata f. sp. sojae]